MEPEESFPRQLSSLERALLLWVLPADRPGYAVYRDLVDRFMVVGEGRRGDGDYILARPGTVPDVDSPLPQLLAFGLVRLPTGELTISVRERLSDQLEFEIAGSVPQVTGQDIETFPRWTYSTWMPTHDCPICGEHLRLVPMETVSGRKLVLALCGSDQRIWLHDALSVINYLIPMTGFVNEVVLQEPAQDRRQLPDFKRFFAGLEMRSDAMLIRAFASYNRLRTRIVLGESLVIPAEGSVSWFKRAARRLLRKADQGSQR